MKNNYTLLFLICLPVTFQAQRVLISGTVVAAHSFEKLTEVTITLVNKKLTTTSLEDGSFKLRFSALLEGHYILVFKAKGYVEKRIPIHVQTDTPIALGTIVLTQDLISRDLTILALSDIELATAEDEIALVPGALHAQKDAFQSAVAYDFSSAFFRRRGQGSETRKVTINGLEMNSLSHGKPEWNTWGGLTPVQRQQEFSTALDANPYTFGDLGGNTHISMRPSEYRTGTRISYALANKTYTGMVNATYNSGLLPKGWAYSISTSRRFGKEGSRAGTPYDANSFFIGIEKQWKHHALSLIGLYSPNTRGRATAITEEVYQLKNRSYNPHWGYQNGRFRNARVQKVNYPMGMLTHYWNLNSHVQLQTNFFWQSGNTSYSRIDTGGTNRVNLAEGEDLFIGGGSSATANPVHPTALPSFYTQEENPSSLAFQNAFLAQEHFRQHGQLDWDTLIAANQQQNQQGQNATYIVYEDIMDNTILHGNISIRSTLNDRFIVQSAVSYRNEQQTHYAKVTDLLGGSGFLDIDRYAEPNLNSVSTTAQSDVQHPNRIVVEGDRYKYQYLMTASKASGFLQGYYTGKHMEGTLGGFLTQTQYQRTGVFENGYFPGTASFGKSDTPQFFTYGIKGALTYKINWKNTLNLLGAQYTKAPTITQTFTTPRQNNNIVSEILGREQLTESITHLETKYTYRGSKMQSTIAGYYTQSSGATRISSFFTQALLGNRSAFVQQIIADMDTEFIGAELGVSYPITATLTIQGALALGQHRYANAPHLTLTSTNSALAEYNGVLDLGTTALQHYHLSNGPQHAAQLGFQYRDPKYWWFGLTANYFAQSFSAISALARTQNFSTDSDGLPFNDYDPVEAKQLLAQERFDPYLLINATAGTSWRFKKITLGLFVAVQNLGNAAYKTGGFESSRMANYTLALAESQRKTPVYGSRYYYGAGTTYYCNLYLKF